MLKIITSIKLWQLLVIGFILRVGAVIAFPQNELISDAHTYLTAGTELFQDGLIQIHNVMPLHPIWFGIISNLLILKFLDAAVSTLTIYVVYKLAFIIFKSRPAAILAALITTGYPFFIFYTTLVVTETIYIFLLVSCFYCLYKKKFLLGSVLLVLSILQRPTLELLAPLLIFAFAYFVHKTTLSHSFRQVSYYLMIYLLLMTPWWIHQYKKYDTFVRLNLGDGIVWYSGNNPMNKSGGGVTRKKEPDMDLTIFSHIKDPVEKNNAMKQAAFEFIKNNPFRFIELSGLKFLRFWRLYPYAASFSNPSYILISLASYGVVLFFFVTFLMRLLFNKKNRELLRPLIPVFFLISYFTIVHMILIASIRYRLPLEPFLIIIASYSLIQLTTGNKLEA